MTPQKRPLATRWAAWQTAENLLLFGLIVPTVMNGMVHHMFGVALPAIRRDFALGADTTAWVSMAYSLPFIALMPLYGRMGDGLGRRRLLIGGIGIFMVGVLVMLSALFLGESGLPLLFIGRAIQGVGLAGFVPLSLAIISQRFAPGEQGRVMGAWNSAIPLTGLVVPALAGLLVDGWGWWAIYPPIVAMGILSIAVMRRHVPGRAGIFDTAYVRRFDWVGVGLLGGGLVALFFYTSSRPITGVPPLQDWRLLTLCLLLMGGFVFWERRRSTPYLDLTIFRNHTFTLASLVAGLRMFLMSGISFLMPLYLTDVYHVSASVVGTVLAVQAGMLFVVSRAGGQIADRWGSRLPIGASMVGLIGIMALLAALPETAPLWIIFGAAAGHGLVIGLSLAPLHRSALQGVAAERVGMAAGLYSMLRFAGQILGVALAGVLLQRGLDQSLAAIIAYQEVFWLYAGVAVVAALASWRMVTN